MNKQRFGMEVFVGRVKSMKRKCDDKMDLLMLIMFFYLFIFLLNPQHAPLQ
jgi:hypothetical protein